MHRCKSSGSANEQHHSFSALSTSPNGLPLLGARLGLRGLLIPQLTAQYF